MIKPAWLKKPTHRYGATSGVRGIIKEGGLNTVCKSARCPNLGECFSSGVATFMILGDVCSRSCGFCAVKPGAANNHIDDTEANRVALSASRMDLSHIVITSVTRDDLADGGARQFYNTVVKCRELLPGATIEVLTPDFQGSENAIDTVVESRPTVFNHNVETVPLLYKTVRPAGDYNRSLNLLHRVKSKAAHSLTKSGMMLGLGETWGQVVDVMKDLRAVECDIITIGQYLQPTMNNLPVKEYIHPDIFDKLAVEGERLGFHKVFAGPFVRSSYHAADALK